MIEDIKFFPMEGKTSTPDHPIRILNKNYLNKNYREGYWGNKIAEKNVLQYKNSEDKWIDIPVEYDYEYLPRNKNKGILLNNV